MIIPETTDLAAEADNTGEIESLIAECASLNRELTARSNKVQAAGGSVEEVYKIEDEINDRQRKVVDQLFAIQPSTARGMLAQLGSVWCPSEWKEWEETRAAGEFQTLEEKFLLNLRSFLERLAARASPATG